MGKRTIATVTGVILAGAGLFLGSFLATDQAFALQVAQGVFPEEGEIKPYRVCVPRSQGTTIVHYDNNSITLSPGSCISFEAKSVRIERRDAQTASREPDGGQAQAVPPGTRTPPKYTQQTQSSPQFRGSRIITNPNGYSYVEPPYYNYSRSTPPHYRYKSHSKVTRYKRRRR